MRPVVQDRQHGLGIGIFGQVVAHDHCELRRAERQPEEPVGVRIRPGPKNNLELVLDKAGEDALRGSAQGGLEIRDFRNDFRGGDKLGIGGRILRDDVAVELAGRARFPAVDFVLRLRLPGHTFFCGALVFDLIFRRNDGPGGDGKRRA